QMARIKDVPGEEDLMLAIEADAAAYSGHLQKARDFSRRAALSAEEAHEKETAAIYRTASALREALFGNAKIAQRTVTLSGRSGARDLGYAVALTSGYAGDAKRTRDLADTFSKVFPEDATVPFNYLPTLRAKFALLQGTPQEALHFLEVA